MPADGQGNRIIKLRVTADMAGDGHLLPRQLLVVEDVIRRDAVNVDGT